MIPNGTAADRRAPTLVVINGPPAAGKTTVARELARALHLPLFAKDDIKEALFDSLGTGDRSWSRTLGAATFDLLLLLAERQVRDGRSAAIEANWDADLACPRFEALRSDASFRLVELHLTAPQDVLRRRFAERAARGDRHAGHLDTVVGAELDAGLHRGRWTPLPCADQLVLIDTANPGGAAAEAVAAVRAALVWVPTTLAPDEPGS